MKLVKKDLDKDGNGELIFRAEESEDMWHLYHLIAKGDEVRSSTWRRVQSESTTGSVDSKRIKLSVTIRVEKVDFDPADGQLHLSGPNVVENDHVKMGAFHTLDIEMQKNVSVHKQLWDSVALARVQPQDACDPGRTADVAAVIMTEGLAFVCLIKTGLTITRAKVEKTIPRKRKGAVDSHASTLLKFYEAVVQAIKRHVDFSVVKCVIVASPGFVKDDFLRYMNEEAVRAGDRTLIENKAKFLPVHSHTGYRHSLKEVLADPLVQAQLVDTKALAEVKALDAFYAMLKKEPDRAFYGPSHVFRAIEHDINAIDTLMVTDELFRSCDLATRKKYVALVDTVRGAATVHIFSDQHVSGEALAQLGGVAALLRYPMPEVEEVFDDEDSSE